MRIKGHSIESKAFSKFRNTANVSQSNYSGIEKKQSNTKNTSSFVIKCILAYSNTPDYKLFLKLREGDHLL